MSQDSFVKLTKVKQKTHHRKITRSDNTDITDHGFIYEILQ